MSDISRLDAMTQAYFDALPPMLKEQIMQSSVEITCREDLEKLHINLLKQAGPTV